MLMLFRQRKLPSLYRAYLLVGKVGEKERKKGKEGGTGEEERRNKYELREFRK